MRRWILLAMLWIAGTAVATGVVFEAVVVMSRTFRDAADESPASRRPKRPTTTESNLPPSNAPATTASTSTATSGEGTTVATTLQPSQPESTTSPTASNAASTTADPRTTPPPTVPTSRTTTGTSGPPPTEPQPTSPPPTTTATVPTTPPTTPPPTTPPPPTTAAACVAQPKKVAAGANLFFVRVCDQDVRLSGYAKAANGYSATVVSAGPVVEVIFKSASTTYHCTISVSGDTLLGYPCDQT